MIVTFRLYFLASRTNMALLLMVLFLKVTGLTTSHLFVNVKLLFYHTCALLKGENRTNQEEHTGHSPREMN